MRIYKICKKTYKILVDENATDNLKKYNKFKDIKEMKSLYYVYLEEFTDKQQAITEFKNTYENSEVEYDREWNDEKGCYDKYIYLTKYFLVDTYKNGIICILNDSYLLSSQINTLNTEWLKRRILYKEFTLEEFKKVLEQEKWRMVNEIPKNVGIHGSVIVIKAMDNYGSCNIEIFYKKINKGILLTVNKIK